MNAKTQSLYPVVQYAYDIISFFIWINETLDIIEKSQKKIGAYM